MLFGVPIRSGFLVIFFKPLLSYQSILATGPIRDAGLYDSRTLTGAFWRTTQYLHDLLWDTGSHAS
jgi:hypothetical protein